MAGPLNGPTDEQIVDALGRVCARQRDATALAVWSELHTAGRADTEHFRGLHERLNRLARQRRIARHRREGDRGTYFRAAGTPLPLFSRPWR